MFYDANFLWYRKKNTSCTRSDALDKVCLQERWCKLIVTYTHGPFVLNLLLLWHKSSCFMKIKYCFWKATLFSTQSQFCLTFSWIEVQMLLRCCLIHTNIILRDFLYYDDEDDDDYELFLWYGSPTKGV